MVLIDSSVIINFLNHNHYKHEVTQLITNKEIATTEIIIMEVLQGIRDDNVYAKVKKFLDSITLIPIEYDDYILSANIYRSCRKEGKTIRKSIDCLIASICINNDLTLFANDKDFRYISECFELKVYTV